mgnify:CR=1 FL=1
MRRYATPTAIISVSSGRTKISINGLAKMKTNTDTRSAKNNSRDKCTANTPVDTVVTSGPEVLCNKGGKGVPKFLHGHIGEGVDFYRGGKCGHDGRPEAVHQALYHQNTEIHDRLLHAGQQRKMRDFRHESPIKTHVTAGNTQARHTRQCVQPQPDTGYPLCKHSRRCSSCHAPMKHQHTHKVQHDVQYRRDPQKIKGAAELPTARSRQAKKL